METWDALTARRNVRTFEDRPIPHDVLETILEAARRSPSSNNKQRWDFVVVTDRQRLEELANVWRGAAPVASSAATIAIVAPESAEPKERESIQYDLGQATAYIMLAAADAGVGSGHAAVMDQELARRILGFPGGHFCAWLIPLGYPSDRPLRPIVDTKRRPIDDVVHREQW